MLLTVLLLLAFLMLRAFFRSGCNHVAGPLLFLAFLVLLTIPLLLSSMLLLTFLLLLALTVPCQSCSISSQSQFASFRSICCALIFLY
jgi:hypothetical protein